MPAKTAPTATANKARQALLAKVKTGRKALDDALAGFGSRPSRAASVRAGKRRPRSHADESSVGRHRTPVARLPTRRILALSG